MTREGEERRAAKVGVGCHSNFCSKFVFGTCRSGGADCSAADSARFPTAHLNTPHALPHPALIRHPRSPQRHQSDTLAGLFSNSSQGFAPIPTRLTLCPIHASLATRALRTGVRATTVLNSARSPSSPHNLPSQHPSRSASLKSCPPLVLSAPAASEPRPC